MLKVGVDCEEISRFRRMPFNSRNEIFYRKIFTPKEIEYCTTYRDPYPRFAVRFAAKEATIKALNSIAKLFYTDIEVKKGKGNQPVIRIPKGKCADISRLAIALSMAHSNSQAFAVVITTDNKKLIRQTRCAVEKSTKYAKRRYDVPPGERSEDIHNWLM